MDCLIHSLKKKIQARQTQYWSMLIYRRKKRKQVSFMTFMWALLEDSMWKVILSQHKLLHRCTQTNKETEWYDDIMCTRASKYIWINHITEKIQDCHPNEARKQMKNYVSMNYNKELYVRKMYRPHTFFLNKKNIKKLKNLLNIFFFLSFCG